MITAQGDKVLLGRGKLYFDRFTSAGVTTGLRFLGTCEKLELTTSDEIAKVYDYSRADAPLLDQALTRREVSLAITLKEFTKENLALVLMGEESAFTQTSTPVVDESLTTSVKKGRVYKTAGRRIGTVTVKKSPSTTLVLGTDYDIADAELGLIHIREGSVTVTDGDTILASYTPAAIAAPGINRVQAAKTSTIQGKLVFVGDPSRGVQWDLEAWKLSITPTGALGFITQAEYGAFELAATVLSDEANHPTEPYYRLTQRN